MDREDRWRLKAAAILILGYLIFCGLVVVCQADEVGPGAVIHHTASPDVSVATIDRWHRARGFTGCGYHIVIRKDGTVEFGRPLDRKGAHARGRNNRIGIALTGYDTFTKEQIATLKCVLNQYGVTRIERHHARCPGRGLKVEGLL